MRKLLSVFSNIISEIGKPSLASETAFLTLLIAIGHAVIGAALTWIWDRSGEDVLGAHVALPLGYFFVKELLWDLRQNGRFLDSVLDTTMVLFGTFYWWQDWIIWVIPVSLAATVAGHITTRSTEG